MPRCAISIDVDSIACYYRIHGLGPAPAALGDVIMRRCVPRFAELLDRRGIRATFFVVAGDLDPHGPAGTEAAAAVARARVAALAAAGHEIGNHSYSHPYDLARFGAAEAGAEIELAHALLSAAAGRPVQGFRAPGYDLSAAMMAHLVRLDYRYDSSIFPAPGYYAAKAAVMGALAALGRQSGAVLTNPRALAAPAEPYRPAVDAPWRRGQAALMELPVAVTPGLRVPAIGTSLLLAPGWLRERLIGAMRGRRLFNFELHGIDLADAAGDGIPAALVARQPDLRLPLAEKQRRFEAMLDHIAGEFELCTLSEAASAAQRAL